MTRFVQYLDRYPNVICRLLGLLLVVGLTVLGPSARVLHAASLAYSFESMVDGKPDGFGPTRL